MSPYATGGGGVTFERKVAVQYLARQLTGDGTSELGDGRRVVSVAFQQTRPRDRGSYVSGTLGQGRVLQMTNSQRSRPCGACQGRGVTGNGGTCRVCRGSGELWGNASAEEMRTASKRKNHHFVPVWYQNNFTTSKGTLFWCDKRDGQIKECAPRVLFRRRRLYHAVEPHTQWLLADAEGALAELDSENAKLVDRLRRRVAEAGRQWRDKRIYIEDLQVPLGCLVNNLLVRNPKIFEGSIDRISSNARAQGEDTEQEDIARTVPIAMMNQIVAMSQEPFEPLRNARIGVGTVPDGETLVVGDIIAGNLMFDSFRLYGLPIDSRTIVLWQQDATKTESAWEFTGRHAPIVELSKYNARRFNASTRNGSRFLACSSKSTLKRLVSGRRH